MKNLPIYLSLLLLLTCAKEDNTSLIEGYQLQISQLNSKITEYSNQVSQLQSTVNSLNNQVNTIPGLEDTITSLNEQIAELEETIEALTSEVSTIPGLNDEISTLEETIASLNEQIESLELILNPIEISLNSYENQRSGIRWGWGDQTSNPITRPNWQCCQKPEYWNNGQVYEDINNDGYQDILLSAAWDSQNNVTVDWWINNGQNEFELDSTYIIESTMGTRAHKILETDVNNDTIKDFIILGVDERVPGDFDGNFTVLIREGEYFRVNRVNENTGLWFHNGAAGDLNGDGNVDVVAAQWIWWGDGNGNFTKSNIDTDQWINAALVYEIIDYNKDGFNDLIIATHYRHDSTTIIYGSENWSSPTIEKIDQLSEVYTNIMDIEIYDLDGDEILDIIELRNSEETENRPVSSANSMLLSSTNIDLDASKDGYKLNGENDTFGWSIFKIDDIDGDGVDDIVSENYHDGNYNGLKLIGNVWVRWLFE